MNLYEFCEKFNISLTKAKRMQKANVLRLDPVENALVEDIRMYLVRGQTIPAIKMAAMIENPQVLPDLASRRKDAEKRIAELDGPEASKAPEAVVRALLPASEDDQEALSTVINWVKTILPERPVAHGFIAVRILLAVPEALRQYEAPRIRKVLLKARKHPSFDGWWYLEGVKRNVTYYMKPKLLDL